MQSYTRYKCSILSARKGAVNQRYKSDADDMRRKTDVREQEIRTIGNKTYDSESNRGKTPSPSQCSPKLEVKLTSTEEGEEKMLLQVVWLVLNRIEEIIKT